MRGFNFEDIWKMENLPVLKTIALPDDERWYAPSAGLKFCIQQNIP